ncbi:LysR family transcriptional regulator [Kibdelosporangium phytohabitans]|uniref:HTH lysR-type domain-containing protein n=1 Tax=Kibdelosporangium phytohabitans TaxID=860235 RepID=A0A0N9HZ79_9PSEU|nr:LysR family transcriptional regulator [Kibdelosporangium phytohabitans]ALG08723.1 hypothetical protein AOZ06_18980 [Kibdelosporangium phytohabitans]MBE1470163.1 DNA-binding transcriptional LysR family regulator [Kibdelosporangium phytohabitans]
MPDDLDMRLLRHFVAVAEALNFSRAARTLFVAQQALSRDIRKLEDHLGKSLFTRTSRRVALTEHGERLLPRARALLAAHDDLLREMTRPSDRVLVDVIGEATTPARVLAAARQDEDGFEFYARHNASLAESVAQLVAGTLDVAFGVTTDLPGAVRARHVADEPLALLVPRGHPFAGHTDLPVDRLRGQVVCCRTGNHVTPEWEALALQVLARCGAVPADDHPYVRGTQEVTHHVRPGEPSVLTVLSQPAINGAVVLPLTDPVPVVTWSMLWRADWTHPGLDALLAAMSRTDP